MKVHNAVRVFLPYFFGFDRSNRNVCVLLKGIVDPDAPVPELQHIHTFYVIVTTKS